MIFDEGFYEELEMEWSDSRDPEVINKAGTVVAASYIAIP